MKNVRISSGSRVPQKTVLIFISCYLILFILTKRDNHDIQSSPSLRLSVPPKEATVESRRVLLSFIGK
jgi:hypothetical protein